MSLEPTIERAQFVDQGDPDNPIPVHFNPETLQYTIINKLDDAEEGETTQYVSQSTGKLTLELVFDTTDTGQDVRVETGKIAKFMEPEDRVPAVVKFEWGAYSFQGMVEAFKETIDFFAAEGVPLRATVNLTLSSHDRVFARPGDEGEDEEEPQSVDVSGSLGRGTSDLGGGDSHGRQR